MSPLDVPASSPATRRASARAPQLIVLTTSAATLARVAGALRGEADVIPTPDHRAARVALRASRGAAVSLLVDAGRGDVREAAAAAAAVAELRGAFPDVHVVGYCGAGSEHSAAICALVRAGADDLVFRDIDDGPALFRHVLRGARAVRLGTAVLQRLHATLPRGAHELAALAVRHPQHAQSVASAAAALGVTSRTLAKRCAQLGLPGPAEVITWCRLLVVAAQLANTSQTLRAIATDLEFPSDTALRNLVRRRTGLSASQIRSPGGAESAWARFAAAMGGRARARWAPDVPVGRARFLEPPFAGKAATAAPSTANPATDVPATNAGPVGAR